mmetsp:Transcript_45320/g.111159  ORF Transcript_45320/g.111159 Transcript_45320/m.111159 type:complete len:223 (-) Transcript_45320:43-711(-)
MLQLSPDGHHTTNCTRQRPRRCRRGLAHCDAVPLDSSGGWRYGHNAPFPLHSSGRPLLWSQRGRGTFCSGPPARPNYRRTSFPLHHGSSRHLSWTPGHSDPVLCRSFLQLCQHHRLLHSPARSEARSRWRRLCRSFPTVNFLRWSPHYTSPPPNNPCRTHDSAACPCPHCQHAVNWYRPDHPYLLHFLNRVLWYGCRWRSWRRPNGRFRDCSPDFCSVCSPL